MAASLAAMNVTPPGLDGVSQLQCSTCYPWTERKTSRKERNCQPTVDCDPYAALLLIGG